MIYIVDQHSPPRYFIQGAVEDSSDGDEPDYKKMRSLKTVALAKDVFANPASYLFEAEVKFRNVYKNSEVRKQTIKATKIEVDASYEGITCEFTPPADHPVFFSYNYQARYSKITLFVNGPATDNERKVIGIFQQYLDASEDPEYTISSLNLELRAALAVPSPEVFAAIKPAACKKLFFEAEPPSIDFYSSNDQIKAGGIFQINKLKITIPTDV